MAYRRTSITWFSLANKAYTNSQVTFYKVDPLTYERLSTLADLYDDVTAETTQPNPLTLDGEGKFSVPIYVDEPVVALISGSEVGAHETGILFPLQRSFRGAWTPGATYYTDDIVSDGAGTKDLYIATVTHVADAWSADKPLRWTLFAPVGEGLIAADEAAVSATQSATSATNSANSAAASLASQTAAAASTSAASTSAASSATSATNSANSAASSATSATNSANAATAAATSATQAATTVGPRLGTYAQTITNWNDARANGWCMADSAANAPEATGWFIGMIDAHNDLWVTQTAYSLTSHGAGDTKAWRRGRFSGEWQPWYRLRLSEVEQRTVTGDGIILAQRAATTAGQASVGAQASDYPTSFKEAALSLFGPGATGATVGVSNANLGVLRFQNASAGLIYTNGAAPIILGTLAQERVRIDEGGNVGIGTNIPLTKLHVVGEARVQHTSNALVTSRSFVQPEGSGYYSAGQRTAYALDTGVVVGAFDHVRTGAGSFEFRLSNWDGGALTQQFVVDGTGNVGIGTTPSVAADARALVLKGPNSGGGYAAISVECGLNTKSGVFQASGADGDIDVGTQVTNTTGSLRLFAGGGEKAHLDTGGTLRLSAYGADLLFTEGGGGAEHSIGYQPLVLHAAANATAFANFGIDDGGGWSGMTVTNFRDGPSHNSQKVSIITAKGGVVLATERMVFEADGYIRMGPTIVPGYAPDGAGATLGLAMWQPSGRFFASQSSFSQWNQTYDGVMLHFARSGAQVGNITVNTTSTAYNTSSDHRLKTEVEPLTGALDRLDQLQPKRFRWIATPDAGKVDGFLAHEAQAVVPEAVTGEYDGEDFGGNPEYQSIDQSKIVPLLVAAVKELRAQVAALQNP